MKFNKSHIEKWAAENLPNKEAGDKYRGAGLGIGLAWWTGRTAINPSVVIESASSGRVAIGTDKLGHFFAQGYEYFEKAVLEGKGVDAAVAYGKSTEEGKYGLGTTGVYSYADLEANKAGYNFYKQFNRL